MASFGGNSFTVAPGSYRGASSTLLPSQIKQAAPDNAKPKVTKEDVAFAKTLGYSDQFLGKQAQAPQFQNVTPMTVNAPNIGNQGFSEFNRALDTAQGNIAQAGQMDPNIARFLQAAQQSGQYSPQAIAMMQQAAQGQGPSAAQNQLQAGVDQSIKAQMAAAGSRGFSAAAVRGAQMQAADMQQQAVNQAAALRAQEHQAAQQAYLQAALEQEQMQRQAALGAANTTLSSSVASQEAKQNAINAFLQGSGQFAGLAQQQAQQQAQMQQAAQMANQDALLKAGMFNQQGALSQFQAENQAQLGYAGLGGDLLQNYLAAISGQAEASRNRSFQAGQNRANRQTQILGAVLGGGASVAAAGMGGA